jgi:hypothetical protein
MGEQRTWLAELMAAVGAIALSRSPLEQWIRRWGADDEEITAVLPGDELVAAELPRTTRALTIDAPVEMVWPWLAQIGEDRGGFYSYSWLEKTAGAHVHNAKTVHSEWQHIRVGDTVWLAKRYGERARQVVAAVEPESYLVLMSPDDFKRVRRGEKVSGSWGFHIRQQNGWTRLIVRGIGGAVGHSWFDIPHFVMEQKMMRGIRDRAEKTRRERTTAFISEEYRSIQQEQRSRPVKTFSLVK